MSETARAAAAPADSPASQQVASLSTPADSIRQLLQQTLEMGDELQAVLVGFVKKDGNAAVRWTAMPPAMVGHMLRIANVKLDRQYAASMYVPATASPTAPVRSQLKTFETLPRRAMKKSDRQQRKRP